MLICFLFGMSLVVHHNRKDWSVNQSCSMHFYCFIEVLNLSFVEFYASVRAY